MIVGLRRLRFWALTCLCAVAAPMAVHADRVALVISQSAYDSVPDLGNPPRDAAGVAGALRDLGFDVTERADLTEAALGRALRQFARQARGSEIALIYYAGHGIEVDGENYLVPTDATLSLSEDVEFEAVEASLAARAVGRATRLGLLLLDACRENPFPASTRRINRGLGRIGSNQPNVLISYAAAAGALASDGAPGGHSPYARALIDVLTGPRREVRLLLGDLRDKVAKTTEGEQLPHIEGSIGGTEIHIHPAVDPCDALPPWEGHRCMSRGGVAVYVAIAPPVAAPPVPLAPIVVPAPIPEPPQRRRAGDVFRDFAGAPQPGDVFRDFPAGPEMVVIPDGSFLMGSPANEAGRASDEGPQTRVAIGSFALGKYEVTVGEFRRFVEATGHDAGDRCRTLENGSWGWRDGKTWRDPGFEQTGDHPVACVNVDDAEAYIAWLNEQTGQTYRLPSEAEWEYAARSGTTTRYPWGDAISRAQANYGKEWCCGGEASGADQWVNTSPVGSFSGTRFGLHDMIGNVREWTADCLNRSYDGRPRDGSAWRAGDCTRHVVRGGSWYNTPLFLRSAYRGWNRREGRSSRLGFRVARALP